MVDERGERRVCCRFVVVDSLSSAFEQGDEMTPWVFEATKGNEKIFMM
jgi:hypothetical protein